jgi:hypothetical protein
MSIELPHYTQAKDNTCALACLRMVLATCGTHVLESELEAQATMEVKGTPIDELVRLARQYHLVADVQDTTVEDLRSILADGKLPIAYHRPRRLRVDPEAACEPFPPERHHPQRHPHAAERHVCHAQRPAPAPGHSQDHPSLPPSV